jgi:hypothetical protein
LANLGWTKFQVDEMTPEEAKDIIENNKSPWLS